MAAWSTYVLGVIGLGWGQPDQARVALENALELARALDYPLIVGGSLRQRGVLAVLEGDRQRGAQLLSEALRHWAALGDRVQLWETLRSVAIALAAAGERATAVRLLDGADAAPVARGLAPIEQVLLARVLPDRPVAAAAGESLEALSRLATDALAGVAGRRGAGAGRRWSRRSGCSGATVRCGRSPSRAPRCGCRT